LKETEQAKEAPSATRRIKTRLIWRVLLIPSTSFRPYKGSYNGYKFNSYNTTWQFKNQEKNKKNADISTENAD